MEKTPLQVRTVSSLVGAAHDGATTSCCWLLAAKVVVRASLLSYGVDMRLVLWRMA